MNEKHKIKWSDKDIEIWVKYLQLWDIHMYINNLKILHGFFSTTYGIFTFLLYQKASFNKFWRSSNIKIIEHFSELKRSNVFLL